MPKGNRGLRYGHSIDIHTGVLRTHYRALYSPEASADTTGATATITNHIIARTAPIRREQQNHAAQQQNHASQQQKKADG